MQTELTFCVQTAEFACSSAGSGDSSDLKLFEKERKKKNPNSIRLFTLVEETQTLQLSKEK